MKSVLRIILLISLLTSLVNPAASAAIKPGSVCKKLNNVSTVAGFKYTCVKQGKKLIWIKGERIYKSEVAIIEEPKEISGFQDAIERPQDVSYWAWKKSSIQALSSKIKGPSVELLIGPNTKLSNPNPQLSIDAVTRLYPGFRKPNKVYAIYYSYKDIDWAQAKYASIYSDAQGQEARNSCQKVEFCWGASGTINRTGDGVLLAAVMSSNPDRNHTSGTLEAHEYTHILQISSFYGTVNQSQAMCCIKAFTPWWFAEGGAEFSQLAAIFPGSFQKYSEDRRFWANELLKNRESQFTESWIANFIKPPDTQIWMDPATQWHLYDLGMLVSEIFTSIKGPEINLQIYKDIAQGMTWESSFREHFGLTWDEAAPLISKSVAGLINK